MHTFNISSFFNNQQQRNILWPIAPEYLILLLSFSMNEKHLIDCLMNVINTGGHLKKKKI